MWKKILIGFLVLVVLLLAAGLYLNHRNRTLSPPGEAHLESGGMSIEITYSRPSARGRQVFGEGKDVLQPFGEYWRLGANESTEFEFSEPVTIWSNSLPAGKHKVYCYPGPESFRFAFAPADGAWGAMEPDAEKEYFRIDVPVSKLDNPVEQFTIRPETSADGKGIDVYCEFDSYRLTLPFKPNS